VQVEILSAIDALLLYCTYGRQEITAWRPRSVRARDFVIFREKNSCIARARRGRPGLTVYPPRIQIRDVSLPIARRDHRKSKFGLLHGNFYTNFWGFCESAKIDRLGPVDSVSWTVSYHPVYWLLYSCVTAVYPRSQRVHRIRRNWYFCGFTESAEIDCPGPVDSGSWTVNYHPVYWLLYSCVTAVYPRKRKYWQSYSNSTTKITFFFLWQKFSISDIRFPIPHFRPCDFRFPIRKVLQ
jgi:hypothetical protein